MKKVVGYTRVSTPGQCADDCFGLEVQEAIIRDYCEKNDMDIVGWYTDEGESGSRYREGFDEIVNGEVSNPPIEAVVVAKSDRVARDINIYFYYYGALQRKGVELISVTEDFGQFGVFASMLRAFTLTVAEMERNAIRDRTSLGRLAKAKTGGYSGGGIPFGYKLENGKLVIQEDEANVVREIFRLRDSGLSYNKVRDELKRLGYVGRRGKPFEQSGIVVILKNRKTYEGYYRYGKRMDWVEGEHEAILGGGKYES